MDLSKDLPDLQPREVTLRGRVFVVKPLTVFERLQIRAPLIEPPAGAPSISADFWSAACVAVALGLTLERTGPRAWADAKTAPEQRAWLRDAVSELRAKLTPAELAAVAATLNAEEPAPAVDRRRREYRDGVEQPWLIR